METTAKLWPLLEVSMDVPIAAVLSHLDGFSHLKKFSLDSMFPPTALRFIPVEGNP